MKLDLDNLFVDSFEPGADEASMEANSVLIQTVLYETEQVSCGGTCRTCNCWA